MLLPVFFPSYLGLCKHRGDLAWNLAESMLSGLCRYKFLEQKWLACKSSLVSLENWHPKAATQSRAKHPEKPLGEKFPNLAWILAPKEAWIRRGCFGAGNRGLKFGRFWDRILDKVQRKTKGQQLKGKIVSALFHTFWHFSTLFHTFPDFFRIFPPGLFLRIKGFYCCFSSKIIKEKKKKETKPFCTLVVARLSSSEKFVPVSGKIRDRLRAAKSKIHCELLPQFPLCLLVLRL